MVLLEAIGAGVDRGREIAVGGAGAGLEGLAAEIGLEQVVEVIDVGGVGSGVVPPGVRHRVVLVVGIHEHGDADLLEIAPTLGGGGLLFGPGQCGE